ncbi:MAG: hypothetical protein ABJE95_18815 [Byssovorax sp.]
MTTDRRTRFRDYMRRLDPTGDPVQAVASGFYVAPPNAVSQRIATRIELEPASSHLLVGGIGSGKTTELIAIERKLAEVEDLFPVRVDVPSRHRLEKLKPGVLVALAATEACAELKRAQARGFKVDKPVEQAVIHISTITKGYWWDPSDDEHPDEEHWVKGMLEAPEPSEDVRMLSDLLSEVNAALQRHPVILFDGLDRVADLSLLASVFAEDVPALGRAGVGLVIVGPQSLRFSPHRFVEKAFETVHLHGAVGVDANEGIEFLMAVLRARADDDVLPDKSSSSLARWSGGLLRDLVALGRAAGAEAYAGGADTIQPDHVDTARDRFGRDLLLGCTKEMVARIKELVPKKHVPGGGRRDTASAFTVATELDQHLLVERLIIEVPGTPVRYVPHPTIVPLVAGLGSS